MKQFEKWWCEHKKGLKYFLFDRGHCSLGWNSALEWVLTKVKTSNSDGSIIQYIKDELKDE